MQSDRRFVEIAEEALAGQDIHLKNGDGAQFVAAGDLARLYRAVLESGRSREVYVGLAAPFVTWQAIAEQAVRLAASRSRLVVEGEPVSPCRLEPSKIREHFGLDFGSAEQITEHLKYLIGRASTRAQRTTPEGLNAGLSPRRREARCTAIARPA